ncbi:PA14 domain-containing protein [Hymenobacter setariae]|uniref:PA14 domain-containing protein n=1 Tax=Hymenobacter setariae TaxID=2594794 RepID=UPI001F319AE5|nr:PA14 domain-containing protein [Hymenobacter setariae]
MSKSVLAQNACGSIDPAGNASQSGLYAEYYTGYWYGSAADNAGRSAFFTNRTPAIRRIETTAAVNYAANNSWGDLYNGGAGPAGGTAANPDNFSARYRGGLNIPTAGSYTFYLSSDDAGYLWIDGDARAQNPSLDNANIKITGTGTEIASGALTLTQGYHDLAILYGENTGNNYLILKYTGPGVTTRTVVPSSWFCTGIRSVPTALTYAPATSQTTYGTAGSSVAPTVANGNSPVTSYAITNAGSLPAGISINTTTGVLTAGPTVLPGAYAVGVSATNTYGTAAFPSVYTFNVYAPGCAGIDPYGNPSQPGLLAEYYKGYFADQPGFFTNNTAYPLNSTNNPARIQRVETAPNYTTDGAWNASGLALFTAGVAGGSDAQPSAFSARYRGRIYISTAGVYTFYLTSDDASYLLIDGNATAQTASAPYTVNNGGGHGTKTVSGTAGTATAPLAVGWHNLLLLYGNDPSSSYLKLEYSGADNNNTQQVIPTAVLCTGIQSVPTGLAYSPGATTYAAGSTASSAAPTVYSGNTTPLTYAITNAGSLPAGITINPATGVLSGNGTVTPGTYTVSMSATNAYGTAAFPTVYTFTVLAQGCTGNDAGGNAAQSGLYGEYYTGYFGNTNGTDTDANLAFFNNNTPKLQAVASTLNYTINASWSSTGLNLFTAGAASNSDAAPATFSARYRGRIYIATPGTYTFSLNSDDGSYVFLDEAATATTLTIASATVNNGGLHSSGTTKSGSKDLTVGLHDILVLYGQNPTDSYLTLQYAGPAGSGINQQIVPTTVLCSSSSPRPLPVTLTRFEAQALGAVVAVSWTTASEQSSASFEVERSADGLVFTKIGQLAAAGTTSQGQQYQVLDRAPLSGLSYYRLRQLDLGGAAHYSPVVPVQLASSAAPRLALAPNPTTGRVAVQLVQATAQAATLQVLDALGRTVYQQALPATATQEHTLDLQALPAGVYLVRVTSAAGIATQRLVRQ